ncbi:hypothetical protein BJX62DRAFT_214355 [Aspergillus germanicus]
MSLSLSPLRMRCVVSWGMLLLLLLRVGRVRSREVVGLLLPGGGSGSGSGFGKCNRKRERDRIFVMVLRLVVGVVFGFGKARRLLRGGPRRVSTGNRGEDCCRHLSGPPLEEMRHCAEGLSYRFGVARAVARWALGALHHRDRSRGEGMRARRFS